MDNETKIKKEMKELLKEFNISGNKKSVIKKLISHCAVLEVTIKQQEEEIKKLDSTTTVTINASQEFVKANPILKEYRDNLKSYQAIIKQLNELTQKSDSNAIDELEEFIGK